MGTRGIIGTGSVLLSITCAATPASAAEIRFDVDPGGNPVTAPTTFASTTPLRDLYAPLGVTFSGPGPNDGGAILSGGGFGVNPRSAPNFFAFSRSATMQNGGVPRDPETINFTSPNITVTIFASGGGQAATFRMDAFDSVGTPAGSFTATNTPGQYATLSVTSAVVPIHRVVLTELTGDNGFVYDDLTFTPIPEPTSAALVALAGLLARRRRR